MSLFYSATVRMCIVYGERPYQSLCEYVARTFIHARTYGFSVVIHVRAVISSKSLCDSLDYIPSLSKVTSHRTTIYKRFAFSGKKGAGPLRRSLSLVHAHVRSMKY